MKAEQQLRWRLILGETDSEHLNPSMTPQQCQQDKLLDYLYGQEYRRDNRNIRGGTLDDSSLTIPEWINGIHELFPKETIERLEKDALERYQIQEMVTNPELLKRAQPSLTLLKAILHTKHLMNQEVLALARTMAKRVIAELLEKLARPMRHPFLGRVHRLKRSHLKIAKNFDAKETIRRNLKHYDRERGRLVIETPYFHSRIRRQSDKWRLIILVDQSGSMMDSVIYSAVTASIFWGIQALDTHLVVFDTNIVDLTAHCQDPVETLMKVQMGGGTDIGYAMQYGASLVSQPTRTLLVLISDFCEGGDPRRLLSITQDLVESGVQVLGLAALDERANPVYDQRIAQQMMNIGAKVGCMTPGELANWVSEVIE
ncbi:VWA domain-containing protein [Hahella sp. KA22]|uniref:VWA domain-containing protein n=1 Tax=Hahella sp. KA22 TaxID=1628392 RepID=UPI000FDE6F97|nr:VWA domain-containing protein [Hahella sp. KA22]AZZ92450.1 VWA domain-containing protein [Hahella sp. KA22]QAY55824.1 VWA domain-containing protein [Hahella sp. KA22]